MKRFLFSGLGLLSIAAVANPVVAADLRRPAPLPYAEAVIPYNWTGIYFGLNGGGGWGRSRFDFPGASTGNFDNSGGLLGVTVGGNYQAGRAVFGIEADYNWTNLRGSTLCPGGAFACGTRNNWLSTVRGRLGYAAGRFMPYVTGGAAFGDIQATISGIGSASATGTGWTVGGGLEWALAGKITAKFEYLYVNLGSVNCGVACGVGPVNVDFATNIVRAGVNLRF
jgi:outer membrane immunogenic protein